MKKIIIDASNLLSGGGVTHLINLLDENYLNNQKYKIYVYSNNKTLSKIDNECIIKKTNKYLNANGFYRFFWQQYLMPIEIAKNDYDLLYSPGGSVPIFKELDIPVITMSRNLLPFDVNGYKLYSIFSKMRIKMKLLRVTQIRSLKKADGVIFLSEYAKNLLSSQYRISNDKSVTIPHGLNKKFRNNKKSINLVNEKKKLLYVSHMHKYKNVCNVIKAIDKLINSGKRIKICLVGKIPKSEKNNLDKCMNEIENSEDIIFTGEISHEEIPKYYNNSDAFIYASSCENFPNIILEAMASGLPIASSNLGPMPEVLKDSALYFNPFSVKSIRNTVDKLISNPIIREELSHKALNYSKKYSWDKTRKLTFDFIKKFL